MRKVAIVGSRSFDDQEQLFAALYAEEWPYRLIRPAGNLMAAEFAFLNSVPTTIVAVVGEGSAALCDKLIAYEADKLIVLVNGDGDPEVLRTAVALEIEHVVVRQGVASGQ